MEIFIISLHVSFIIYYVGQKLIDLYRIVLRDIQSKMVLTFVYKLPLNKF